MIRLADKEVDFQTRTGIIKDEYDQYNLVETGF